MTDQIDTTQIQTLTATVAAQAADLATATEESLAAELAVLEHVIATMRPALRALSSRIRTACDVPCEDSDAGEREDRYHAARGVYVALTRRHGTGRHSVGPVRAGETSAGVGPYCGTDLFLLEDGTWLELEYRGRWSQWQGSVSWWTSTPRTMTTAEVVYEHDVPDVIGALAAALTRYAEGGATARAARLRENAAKLRAILALV